MSDWQLFHQMELVGRASLELRSRMRSDATDVVMPLLPRQGRLIVRSLCPDEKPRQRIDQLDLGDWEVQYSPFSVAEVRRSYLLWRFLWGIWRGIQILCRLLCRPICYLCGWCCLLGGCSDRCPLSWRYRQCVHRLPHCFPFWRYRSLYVTYHTVLFGRRNLTDVRDSLYDNILKYMSLKFGKSSLIFIVDDVENGEKAKEEIEAQHPTTSNCCDQIFVFEKHDTTGPNAWNQQEIRNLNEYVKKFQQLDNQQHNL